VVSALVTIATNPVSWFRQNFGELVVGEIFDFSAFLIARGLGLVELVADAAWAAVTSLLIGLGPAGRALLEVPRALYRPVRALAAETGIAAPVLAAVAVAVVVALSALVLRSLLQTGTETLLDAVPGGEGLTGPFDALRGWLR
jgi:hypothetical protein